MSSGDVSLCLFQTNDKPAPLHLAFVAKTRQQVDDFTMPRWALADVITVSRGYVPMVKITMPLSSSRLMVITLKPYAMRRKVGSPNISLENILEAKS